MPIPVTSQSDKYEITRYTVSLYIVMFALAKKLFALVGYYHWFKDDVQLLLPVLFEAFCDPMC